MRQVITPLAGLTMGISIAIAACSSGANVQQSSEPVSVPTLPAGKAQDFGTPPEALTGDLALEVEAAIDELFDQSLADGFFDTQDRAALDVLGQSGDVRVAWLLSDLLRFVGAEDTRPRIAAAADDVMGVELDGDWQAVTNHLIAWDIEAPPNYIVPKKRLFVAVHAPWEPLFDETSSMDWRYVSWGGVFLDDQPFGDTPGTRGGIIPAADNPAVTGSTEGDWYPDDRIVFGVEINGEARAYPKHIMEIREMVNDTLGGRDFGMPYCTLCGSAQVFFTDQVEGFARPVLRTSGLLSRSNKVMFDLETMSVVDTFTGVATTGSLADAAVILPQASVVTTTWGAWKESHPSTTILAESLDLGRGNNFNPLRGRDEDGPIFPIGAVDPRLPAQEKVLGVVTPEGTAVAFHVLTALALLSNGDEIEAHGVTVFSDGSGLRASLDGVDLGSHEAFWFAWAQFHPNTILWPES